MVTRPTRRTSIAVVVVALAAGTIVLWPYFSRREPGPPIAAVQVKAIAEAIAAHPEIFAEPSTAPGGRIAGVILLGKNPRGVRIITWRTGQISPDGEPLDPWGQPFRITLDRERNEVQVRSAGQNAAFDDADDEVAIRRLQPGAAERRRTDKAPRDASQ